LRSSGCVFTLDFGRSEDADRTATSRGRARRRDQSAGPNCGVENRSGNANLTGEVTGKREVVAGVGDDLDNGPQCSIGPNWESDIGGVAWSSRRREFPGSPIGDEGDDEENCKEESSNHEHHDCKK